MRHTLSCFALAFILCSSTFAAQSEFIDLGTLARFPGATFDSDANGVSADGLTVVGQSLDVAGGVAQNVAFRWRRGVGMSSLGVPVGAFLSQAFTVSADGSRVGGSFRSATLPGAQAMTWSSVAGSTAFAPIGQGLSVPSPIVAIGDGDEFVIGTSIAGGAIRWTPSGGTTHLLGGPGFPLFFPEAASRTGGAVVGTAYEPNSGFSHAAIWREGSGTTLVPILAGWEVGIGTGLSADGETVIGYFIDSTGAGRAGFRWTQASGLAGFGVNGQFTSAVPVDISGDGSVVAFEGAIPRIWTSAAGMQDFRSLLLAGGAAPPPLGFEIAAVSDDGNAFVGSLVTGQGSQNRHAFVAYLTAPEADEIGATYCSPAVANSTGVASEVRAYGSIVSGDDDVTLIASGLPPQALGIFLNSPTQGFVAHPGGSDGNLCLGGMIGRYSQTVLSAGPGGTFRLELSLGATPTPTGLVAVLPGDTWNFQVWHRDFTTAPTSNLSDAVEIAFE